MSRDDSAEPATDQIETPDDALRHERDDLYERLLRTTAEFENYRRRTERERRDLSDALTADVLRDVLPVLDDLDRAAAALADGGSADALARHREGLDLIRRQFLELLRRRGVEVINVLGEDFDPEWHESVGSDPAHGRRDGEITAEVRRGYRIGKRMLRPAMVKVAKA